MKNKGFANDQLIYALVAGALLVIIILGLVYAKPIMEKVYTIFPSLRTEQPQLNKSGLLRYDIVENTVQYYDGTAYLDFPDWTKEVPVGGKKISHGSARFYFADNYYLNNSLREKAKRIDFGSALRNSLREKLYPTQEQIRVAIPALEGCIENGILNPQPEEKEYDIRIRLIAEKSEKCLSAAKGGIVQVGLNGAVEIRRVKEIKDGQYILEGNYSPLEDTEIATLLKNFADEWRDSVLAQPMQIKVNNKDCILVKVEKISNGPKKYLVADLSKPVGTC